MNIYDKVEVLESLRQTHLRAGRMFADRNMKSEAEIYRNAADEIGRCIRILIDDAYAEKIGSICKTH